MPTVDYKLLETQDKRIEFGGEKITNQGRDYGSVHSTRN